MKRTLSLFVILTICAILVPKVSPAYSNTLVSDFLNVSDTNRLSNRWSFSPILAITTQGYIYLGSEGGICILDMPTFFSSTKTLEELAHGEIGESADAIEHGPDKSPSKPAVEKEATLELSEEHLEPLGKHLKIAGRDLQKAARAYSLIVDKIDKAAAREAAKTPAEKAAEKAAREVERKRKAAERERRIDERLEKMDEAQRRMDEEIDRAIRAEEEVDRTKIKAESERMAAETHAALFEAVKGPEIIYGCIILPIRYTLEYTLTKPWRGFIGPYYLGRAGSYFIEASTVIPSQPAALIERTGKNLKVCRSAELWGSGLFYGGLSALIIGILLPEEQAETPVEEQGLDQQPRDKRPWEKRPALFKPAGAAMLAGYGLRLFSLYYAGSTGKKLEEFSEFLPLATHSELMGGAGKSLQTYRDLTYLGYGLEAAGIAFAVAQREDTTFLTIGILTALAGWIISDPVANGFVMDSGEKLEKAGSLMLQWK